MYCTNLQQVYRKNPLDKDFDCWVLLLGLDSDTSAEREIRSKHKNIDTILKAQNVNYSEITTFKGKMSVYEKFKFKNGKHPLFFIFNKHPLQYIEKESFMVMEWGKWQDIDSLKNDLMEFTNFFSDTEFRKKIINARNKKMWNKIVKFLRDNGFDLLKIGITIAVAVF
ncbi:unnamed protein product [marine sediment metagenome]|uniref:Uncharacterized protein n=1 Tax=marine sediment metagenome TaxID=412755 RepID=X1MA48_9ZZZZ